MINVWKISMDKQLLNILSELVKIWDTYRPWSDLEPFNQFCRHRGITYITK